MLKERDIKYWLTRNTPRASCWVVYTEIEHMTKHPDTKVTKVLRGSLEDAESLPIITRDQLNYVYTAYMTTKRLITIFELKNGLYYLLDNRKVPVRPEDDLEDDDDDDDDVEEKAEERPEDRPEERPEEKVETEADKVEQVEKVKKEEKEKEVEMKTVSAMIVSTDLISLLNAVPNQTRKLINLEKVHKMSLTKEDQIRLTRTTGFDFARCRSEEELLSLFRKYLEEIKNLKKPVIKAKDSNQEKQEKQQQRDPSTILDFSGNMSIYPAILEKLSVEETAHIEEILFFQNIRIGKWLFLSRFKNLKVLSFWYMYQLKDDDFNTICKTSPKIEAINIHESYQISNRVMVPILSILKRIERVCLDNKVLICQKNAYQGVVTEKEWSAIRCDSLKYILINSDNLTQDVIDSYLKACINLKRFIMNGLVLKRLRQNVTEGLGPDTITFQAAEDLRLGFTVKKDLRIANLLKDRYEPAYSASMLKIIKQQQMGDYEDEEELDELLNEFKESL